MAEWQTVAQGTNIWNLEATVADMNLIKGTKVRIVMDTWASWAFDMAGAELVFNPFVPDGLDLVDVWGESGKGIVELEADPAWLLVMLAFIKAHWLAITIAGLVLSAIITFIVVMVKLPAAAQIPIWLLVGAAAGVLGLIYVSSRMPAARASPGR